jgi:hypothetical protein
MSTPQSTDRSSREPDGSSTPGLWAGKAATRTDCRHLPPGGRRRGQQAVPAGGAVAVRSARPTVRQSLDGEYEIRFNGIEVERFAKARRTADWLAACRAIRPGARCAHRFPRVTGPLMRSRGRTVRCGLPAWPTRVDGPEPPVFTGPGQTSDRRAASRRIPAVSLFHVELPSSCGSACFTWNTPGPRPMLPADQLVTSGYVADRGRLSAVAPASPLTYTLARAGASGAESIGPFVTVQAWETPTRTATEGGDQGARRSGHAPR